MKNNTPGQVIAVMRPTFLCAAPSVVMWTISAIVGFCLAAKFRETPALMTLFVILSIVALVAVAIKSVQAGIAQACNRYTITTEVIQARTGFFSTRTAQVRISDIRGISITRSFMGRLLGYASAEIGSAATAGSEVKIENVRHLETILNRLNV